MTGAVPFVLGFSRLLERLLSKHCHPSQRREAILIASFGLR
jgi:hypothetical protein